ncbi:MAG TPA: small basic protein [Planctomycetota bacterium]|nr:small basic protein [Planctomycetota bacterium]
MSIHRSLAERGALTRTRNVLTRKERCEKLKETGKWKEEETSIFGLPKVRTQFKTAKKKAPKKEAVEGAAAPGAEGAAAAPAAAGAPAKGGAAPAKGAAAPAKGAAAPAKGAPAPAAGGDKKGAKK